MLPQAGEQELLEFAAAEWGTTAGAGGPISQAEASIGRCTKAEKILWKSLGRVIASGGVE
jgi:hypothetical protein